MARVRRTRYALFQIDPFDPRTLIEDPGASAAADQVYGLSLLTGRRHRLGPGQFELLASVPSREWVPVDDLPADGARELIAAGLLLSDGPGEPATTLRERDAALDGGSWNLAGAVYHFLTRWSGVDIRGDVERLELGAESRAAGRRYVERHGPPPEPFPPPRPGDAVALPDGVRSGGLYEALMARRTARAFATGTPMRAEDLAAILRYVFGAHGVARNVADLPLLKRTSPSGGGLHPIEAYPIVSDVEGVAPGVYHYDARGHRLEPVAAAVERAELTRLLAGQDYFADAQAVVVLTARFTRNHWKYRRHPKAYAGIVMDAGHLSQTLYLVAAERGLGAYVTLAVNGAEIEALLDIDGIAEGVIAVCGCGVPSGGPSPLELRFSPLP